MCGPRNFKAKQKIIKPGFNFYFNNTIQAKVNRIKLGTPESQQRQGASMTSQLRHYFQASQAVHGTDDITTLHF